MPDDDDTANKHAKWIGIWRYIITFLVGVIVAAFTVGSARQKVKDLVAWKEHIAPKIERMDSVGTLSFEHFQKTYDKDQEHTEERLKELEKEMRALERERKQE